MKYRKPKRRIDRVFVHCSASDNPKHDDVSVMDQWHKARGWREVGYHYFIKKNGEIQAGRSVEATPAAQSGHNKYTLAVCLHGLGEAKFTEEQFQSLRYMCAQFHKAHPKATFHGHREVAAKACPVFDYKKVLGLDKNGRLGAKVADKEDTATIMADKPKEEVKEPDEQANKSKPAFRFGK